MSEERFDQIEQRLDSIEKRMDSMERQMNDSRDQLNDFRKDVDHRFELLTTKLDVFQQASQNVVNLAFTLIVAAVVAIIAPIIIAH